MTEKRLTRRSTGPRQSQWSIGGLSGMLVRCLAATALAFLGTWCPYRRTVGLAPLDDPFAG